MAALSGPPATGPLGPYWTVDGLDGTFARGLTYPSGNPGQVGGCWAVSSGRASYPRRQRNEFNPDMTLLGPAIGRRVDATSGTAGIQWCKQKECFPARVAQCMRDGAYAITDEFDDVPIDWIEGDVEASLPRCCPLLIGVLLPRYWRCGADYLSLQANLPGSQ